jgi:hypothetical protein
MSYDTKETPSILYPDRKTKFIRGGAFSEKNQKDSRYSFGGADCGSIVSG